MKEFTEVEGVTAPIELSNIDTDMIIPKQFLKTIEREGLGKSLFYDQRYEVEYKENPQFILNKDPWRNAKVIIAGDKCSISLSDIHPLSPVGSSHISIYFLYGNFLAILFLI